MGESELAYKIITETKYPSWGYMLKLGATTVWERWNGYTEKDGFEDPEMNSFNHYSLGSCVEWLYTYVLGIKLCEGKPICISPTFFEKLNYVNGCYAGKNGKIRISIRRNKKVAEVKITADDGMKYTCDFKNARIVGRKKDGNTEIVSVEL